MSLNNLNFSEQYVLIGTDWNLKAFQVHSTYCLGMVLIGTDWNLKWDMLIDEYCGSSINRNRLEFKA